MAISIRGYQMRSLMGFTAAAALVFPVAVAVAHAAQLDPRPFAVVVALAASAGFASPVGSNATWHTARPWDEISREVSSTSSKSLAITCGTMK